MIRLTQKDNNGRWSLKGVKWENLRAGATITKKEAESLYLALWKLKDYEDTGLNPDEVVRMKDRMDEEREEGNSEISRQ